MRVVSVLLSVLLGLLASQVHAQNTVDSGLPAGWQNWASQCGKVGRLNECLNESKRLYFGVGTAVDKRGATRFLIEACNYANQDACSQAATIARDELQALDLYVRALEVACNKQLPTFCREAFGFFASKLEDGNYPRSFMIANRDPARAIRYAEMGCGFDDGPSCAQLGASFSPYAPLRLQGLGVDPDRSNAAFLEACRNGNESGCWFAFYQNTGQQGLPLRPELQMTALGLGCEKRMDSFCRIGANAHLLGENGVAIDQQKAVPFLIGGCEDEGEEYRGIMCANAASALADIDREDPRISEFARRACNIGNAIGCVILANSSLPHDPAAALLWNRQSCRLGHQDGCEWAEEYLEQKRQYEADLAERQRQRREQQVAWEAELRRRAEQRRMQRSWQEARRPRYSSSSSTRSYLARPMQYSPPPMRSASDIYRSVAATSTHTCIYTGGTNCSRF